MLTELTLTEDHMQQMIVHAYNSLPYEACGLLEGKAGRVQAVYAGINADNSPVRYRMDPQEQLRTMHTIELAGRELLGIFHSHTHGPSIPSATDHAQAYYPDAVYIIMARDPNGAWKMQGYNLHEDCHQEVILTIEKIHAD